MSRPLPSHRALELSFTEACKREKWKGLSESDSLPFEELLSAVGLLSTETAATTRPSVASLLRSSIFISCRVPVPYIT